MPLRAGKTSLSPLGVLLRMVFVVSLFLSAGCGDRGGGYIIEPGAGGAGNIAPVAHVGPDQTVTVGSAVVLDSSGSYDPDGQPITRSWKFDSRPMGSTAVLSNAASSSPTFTADRAGVFVISLVVSDGAAVSDPRTVTITAAIVNGAPTADAGADQTVDVSIPVQLDGSGSLDPNGDALTYQWIENIKPWNSAATLSDSTLADPTFVPDVAGTYEYYLVVNDGIVSSSWDKVTITAKLTAVANAGPDQYHTTGPSTVVTLDGSGSYDIAGKSLSFRWSLTRKPRGSVAILDDPAAAHPTFTADREGLYEFSLTMMSNGYANSLPDAVRVTVIADKSIAGLAFTVIDAEYSKQLDRIIMVSGSPANRLHIYDPVADLDQPVALSDLPTSVSISPDGLHAAVGHGTTLSYVDLVSKAVTTILPANCIVTDVVLGGNDYVYAFQDLGQFFGVNLSTGAATAGAGFFPYPGYAVTRAKLHPSGSVLYVAVTSYTTQKYDISSGTPVYMYDSHSGTPYYTANGDLWMLEDGTGFISRSSKVFSANTGTARDLQVPKASLEGMDWTVGVRFASDSSAASEAAAIPLTSDIEVRVFDNTLFTLSKEIALPHFTVGNSNYAGQGKFVFFNSTGAKMFVILQADAASGLTNDFGVVTYE